jgi:hypothetical protein
MTSLNEDKSDALLISSNENVQKNALRFSVILLFSFSQFRYKLKTYLIDIGKISKKSK